jgi:hypothetical protein
VLGHIFGHFITNPSGHPALDEGENPVYFKSWNKGPPKCGKFAARGQKISKESLHEFYQSGKIELRFAVYVFYSEVEDNTLSSAERE